MCNNESPVSNPFHRNFAASALTAYSHSIPIVFLHPISVQIFIMSPKKKIYKPYKPPFVPGVLDVAPDGHPSYVADRRNAVDLNGSGQVPSDYWHSDAPEAVFFDNHRNYPAITFHCSSTGQRGVALTELIYGSGLCNARKPVHEILPPHMQGISQASLTLRWPGHNPMSMNVALIRPGKRGPESVVLGNVGSQIANGWRDYYELNQKRDQEGGILLASGYVTYSHLRLHQIYTSNGRDWEATISYVRTY